MTAPAAPILTTSRLALHPLQDPDSPALLALLSLEPVRRYLLDGEVPDAAWIAAVVSDSHADFSRKGLGLWGARRADGPSLVGLVGFRDFHEPPVEELLFALHPDAWGSGLAKEMAEAAIAHAFTAAGPRSRAARLTAGGLAFARAW